MKKVTMQTLAKKFGVSTVTVHKALTNQKGVSADLRQRIVEAAASDGYIPVRQAQKNLTFVFVVQKNYLLRPNEQLYSEIYYHLNAECILLKAKMHLLVYDDLGAFETSLKSIIRIEPIAGIFIAGEPDTRFLDYIQTLKVPTVCLDFFSADYSFDYIYSDNYYAGFLLTKHLIQKGHKAIGFVGGIEGAGATADRYFGFRRALNAYGLTYFDSFYIDERIEQADFVLPQSLPSAFVCHNDRTAGLLYAKLIAAGLSVPHHVSVAGMDNTELCEHLQPNLTSMGVEKKKFASQALTTMLNYVHDRAPLLHYTKFHLELFERASVLDLNNE